MIHLAPAVQPSKQYIPPDKQYRRYNSTACPSREPCHRNGLSCQPGAARAFAAFSWTSRYKGTLGTASPSSTVQVVSPARGSNMRARTCIKVGQTDHKELLD